MKISKSTLALLIEAYLYDQEVKEGIDWKKANFQIEIDGDRKDISFFKDTENKKVNYTVDGDSLGSRTTANFTTIGSLATLSDEIDVQKAGEKLAKLDNNLKNKPLEKIKKLVRQKMNAEIFPLSVKDIRNAIQPRE